MQPHHRLVVEGASSARRQFDPYGELLIGHAYWLHFDRGECEDVLEGAIGWELPDPGAVVVVGDQDPDIPGGGGCIVPLRHQGDGVDLLIDTGAQVGQGGREPAVVLCAAGAVEAQPGDQNVGDARGGDGDPVHHVLVCCGPVQVPPFRIAARCEVDAGGAVGARRVQALPSEVDPTAIGGPAAQNVTTEQRRGRGCAEAA